MNTNLGQKFKSSSFIVIDYKNCLHFKSIISCLSWLNLYLFCLCWQLFLISHTRNWTFIQDNILKVGILWQLPCWNLLTTKNIAWEFKEFLIFKYVGTYTYVCLLSRYLLPLRKCKKYNNRIYPMKLKFPPDLRIRDF